MNSVSLEDHGTFLQDLFENQLKDVDQSRYHTVLGNGWLPPKSVASSPVGLYVFYSQDISPIGQVWFGLQQGNGDATVSIFENGSHAKTLTVTSGASYVSYTPSIQTGSFHVTVGNYTGSESAVPVAALLIPNS